MSVQAGADLGGAGGAPAPFYSWYTNGNMGRVMEKKRWRKEEKWRERKKKRPASSSIMFCIRHYMQEQVSLKTKFKSSLFGLRRLSGGPLAGQSIHFLPMILVCIFFYSPVSLLTICRCANQMLCPYRRMSTTCS